MHLDCSGLVLAFPRGFCHHWSCLRQDGLGCKTSVLGQSQAQVDLKSVLKVATNATTQEAGLGSAALEQSDSFPCPCPALA